MSVTRRGSRIFLQALFLLLLASCSPGRQQPTPTPAPTVEIPVLHPALQGLYESCSPGKGTICLDRLRQMATAGFKLVINYDQLYGTADS
jgi:hypothetical protein